MTTEASVMTASPQAALLMKRATYASVAVAALLITAKLAARAVTIGLVGYQRHVVARTGSLAIGADELHYRGDIVLNGTVILSLVLSDALGWHLVDPLFGAAIALWIVYSAWQIASAALI